MKLTWPAAALAAVAIAAATGIGMAQVTAPGAVGAPTPIQAFTAPPAQPVGGRHRRGETPAPPSPGGTGPGTPAPPLFSSLDGIWEMQVQMYDGHGTTDYEHLYITQTQDQLSGLWLKNSKTKVPFTGTFDGKQFKIVATEGAQTYTLAGYVDNMSDIVGEITYGAPNIPPTAFTASHRKKEKIIF